MLALVLAAAVTLRGQSPPISDHIHLALRLAVDHAAPEYCFLWEYRPFTKDRILNMEWQLLDLPTWAHVQANAERVSRWGVTMRIREFPSVSDASAFLKTLLDQFGSDQALSGVGDEGVQYDQTALAYRWREYVIELRAHSRDALLRFTRASENGLIETR